MSNTFLLPDLGEGLTEADIVRWLVAEGDTVAVDQPMVEVETAKALVEVPSPYAGTVLILHGAEGETMDVGSPLITIGEAGESGEGSAPVAGTETLAVPPSTGAAAAEAARPGA
ncbi:biotin/lipoyl-containing protein, partial [Micrococcus sp. HSID17227]